VRFHADSVDDSVGASTAGSFAGCFELVDVEHVDAVSAGPFEVLSDEVDAEHEFDTAVQRDSASHVANRPEPEHDKAAAGVNRRTRPPAMPSAARPRDRRNGRQAALLAL
jgi:hypothetical protein